MRHRRHFYRLNRTSEHRLALRRNMAQNLIEHGSITTTLVKAKNLKPFVERLISLAVQAKRRGEKNDASGSLSARRAIHSLLSDRGIIPAGRRNDYNAMSDAMRAKTMSSASGRRYRTGEPKGRLEFTAESVMHRLIESVARRFEDRSGGYTRLIRLAQWRVGDAAPLAVLQLVGDEESPGAVTKAGKTARRLRADSRYAMAVKVSKSFAKREKPALGAAENSDSAT